MSKQAHVKMEQCPMGSADFMEVNSQENLNSKKHGIFSKHIPKETLDTMGDLGEFSASDLIWDQITIQYAAIIRPKKVMFLRIKKIMKELH